MRVEQNRRQRPSGMKQCLLCRLSTCYVQGVFSRHLLSIGIQTCCAGDHAFRKNMAILLMGPCFTLTCALSLFLSTPFFGLYLSCISGRKGKQKIQGRGSSCRHRLMNMLQASTGELVELEIWSWMGLGSSQALTGRDTSGKTLNVSRSQGASSLTGLC